LGAEKLTFEDIVNGLKKTTWARERALPGKDSESYISSRYRPLYTLLDDYIPKVSSSLIDGPLLD